MDPNASSVITKTTMSIIIFILFLSTIASAITIELYFKGENVSIISQIEQMKLKKSISNIFILTSHQEINKMNNFLIIFMSQD